MKKTYLVLLLTLVALTINAIPAKRNIWKTVTLANGSKVSVQLRGDEYLHYWQDAQGMVYEENEDTGFFQPFDFFLISNAAKKRRQNVRRIQQSRRSSLKRSQNVITGKKKGLIILTQFSNKEFKSIHDKTFFENVANTRGFTNSMGFKGSVKDYFIDQSEGQFELDFDVVGPITLEHGYEYYGKNVNKDDIRPGEMIREACIAVKDSVDFKNYDWYGDGEVDQVFVLYAGKGESDGGESNTIWPHMWNLLETTGKTLELDDVTINIYACSSELSSNGNSSGIGAFCHEFSHCMGFPDLYDTSDDGYNFGMQDWSLMDYGCYNGNSFIPSGYTSYERMFCGWKIPIELDNDVSITNMRAISDGGNSYIIYNKKNNDEYYLLENRQLVGWDEALPGHGLLILHVDYDEEVWYNNEVNNTASRQRCTIFHADNKAGVSNSDLKGDPYPYLNNDSLTRQSKPAATLYRTNIDGTKYMDMGIRHISESDDGLISFDVTKETPKEPGEIIEGDTLFYESFDKCNGSGGNDDLWSGIIASIETSNDSFDQNGWVPYKSFCANKCIKVGTSRVEGYIKTPTITLNGVCRLHFRAAPWNKDISSINVELTGKDNINLMEKEFDYMENNQWNDFTVDINGSGSFYLKFWSKGNRFFLDEVVIRKLGQSAGIHNLRMTSSQPSQRKYYRLDGVFVGNDFNTLPSGIYICNGKKIVK